MTYDGESVKTKVVRLQTLWKFVVDNLFVWIRLQSQIINLHSVGYNMWATKLQYRYKVGDRRSGRLGYTQAEVVGLIPTRHVVVYFAKKIS
jgi:hypothetical protein